MKEQLRREIGQRMRKIRKSLGYTQEQMVSYFETGRANYSRIEKGEIFPGPVVLTSLKKNFNISMDWLISGIGDMFLQDPDVKKKKRNFGKNTPEVQELLHCMAGVPMFKHAVLSYFMEYRLKNQEHIDKILSQVEEKSSTIN
jgi:transcriptional regulator with XRE-family HTH domain